MRNFTFYRSESPNGVEVYLHILQLLTTVEEGLQAFGKQFKVFQRVFGTYRGKTWALLTWIFLFPLAAPDGPGESVWEFVCDVVCEDLCQTHDLSVVFHEQKSMLVQTFSVLQALYTCWDQWCSRSDAGQCFISSTAVDHFYCKGDQRQTSLIYIMTSTEKAAVTCWQYNCIFEKSYVKILLCIYLFIFSSSSVGLPLISTVFQVCQYHSEHRDEDTNKEDAEDEQLQALAEITTEFLADLCSQMSKV